MHNVYVDHVTAVVVPLVICRHKTSYGGDINFYIKDAARRRTDDININSVWERVYGIPRRVILIILKLVTCSCENKKKNIFFYTHSCVCHLQANWCNKLSISLMIMPYPLIYTLWDSVTFWKINSKMKYDHSAAMMLLVLL